ncbi:hypothetical protein BCT94_17625 [Vibrio breoganii]|nr:hypothetical protein BCT94_17625 [Vibrio breoganii]
MPVYNSERYLKKSIVSVLSQTYINFELIIVDDCSNDNSIEIIREFRDKRIFLIRSYVNSGVALSRNKALKLAKGQYISFLDSDDLWLPNKLKFQVAVINSRKNAIICHSSYFKSFEDGSISGCVHAKSHVDKKLMLTGNFIGNLTGLFDRSRVDVILQFDVKHEDYLMWFKLLSINDNYYSVGINKPLAIYRVHNKSISFNKVSSSLWHWNILRNELNISWVKSVKYFFLYAFNAISKRYFSFSE